MWKIPVYIILIVFPIPILCQAPDTLWTTLAIDGWRSTGSYVRQTSDGGFILAGDNNQYGSPMSDAFLAKIDQDGNVIWTKSYGGAASDYLNSAQQTADGGFICTGVNLSVSDDGVVYTIRTDANGDSLWTRLFGEPGWDFLGQDVIITNDGCIAVTGNTWDGVNECRLILLKYSDSGELLWSQIYRDFLGAGLSIIQLEDGCYVIAGQSIQNQEDVLLMKTDENGEIIWRRNYGSFNTDSGNSVKQTHDGGFIVCGSFGTYIPGTQDIWLLRTDSEGDTLWTRFYGGAWDEYGHEVDQTLDGGYVITGVSYSYNVIGIPDIYIVRTDIVGNILWTTTYNGGSYDFGESVEQTSDGGFIVAGSTDVPSSNDRAILIRYEPDYNPLVDDLTISISHEDVILNWTEVPQMFFQEYRIYRSEAPYFEVTGMTPLSVQTENSFVDPGAAGGRYFYRVTVVY